VIDLITIHCTATPNGRSFTAEDIDRWHDERGFQRGQASINYNQPSLQHIGYHDVVYTSGVAVVGRGIEEVGAHAEGYNTHSLSTCLIGTDQFMRAQWETLRANVCATIVRLARRANRRDAPRDTPAPQAALALAAAMGVRILGHRDLPNVQKTCPGFDVRAWLAGGMEPLAGHIFEVHR
jgi:hypothetical protein